MVSDEPDPAVPAREQCAAASSPPRTLSITTRGSAGCVASTSTAGSSSRCERRHLLVGDRQRDDQQAGHAVAPDEVAHRVGALLGRLDVEQHQVVLAPLAAPEALDDAAQALDHRGA